MAGSSKISCRQERKSINGGWTFLVQVVLGDVLESAGQATAEEFNATYGPDAALYVYTDVTKQDSVDGGWMLYINNEMRNLIT